MRQDLIDKYPQAMFQLANIEDILPESQDKILRFLRNIITKKEFEEVKELVRVSRFG